MQNYDKNLIIMTHCGLIHPVRFNSEFSAVPARQVVPVLAQLALDVIRVLFLDLGPELVHAENTNVLVKWAALPRSAVFNVRSMADHQRLMQKFWWPTYQIILFCSLSDL